MEKDVFSMDKRFDYLVCVCMGVSYSSIVKEIRNGAVTFDDLADKLGVGSGCGFCKQQVKEIIKKELEGAKT